MKELDEIGNLENGHCALLLLRVTIKIHYVQMRWQ